jgi:hypothetical protein
MKTGPKAAAAAGDTYYFTGRPCIKGHISPRFTSTRACVDCLAAAKAEYRAKPENKAKAIAYSRQYVEDNKEILVAKRKAAYQERREEMLAKGRSWKEANKGWVAAYCSAYKKSKPGENAARAANYAAAKIRATPAWADKAAIAAVYRAASQLTAATGVPHEVDHEYPLRGNNVCGLHVHQNLQVVPAAVNRRKYNKHPHDIVGYAKLVADRLEGRVR